METVNARPRKRRRCSGSVHVPSDDGLTVESSTSNEMEMGIETMTSSGSSEDSACVDAFLQGHPTGDHLCMLELALDSSVDTSKRKSKRSRRDSDRNTKSLKTSEAVSTSGVLGLTRFWQPCLEERYRQCTLPTKTECVDLPSNCSNRFSSSTVQTSKWQTMTIHRPQNASSQKTSFPSSQFLGRVSTGNGAAVGGKRRKVEIKGTLRPVRMRIRFSTAQQRLFLKQWFASTRKLYNNAVHMMKETGEINWPKMERELITNAVSEDWEKDVPRRVRKFGVQEAVKNAKLAKRNRGELHCRTSKECLTEAISIEATAHGGPVRSVAAAKDGSKTVEIRISPNTRLGKEGVLTTKASPLARQLLMDANGLQFGGKLLWEKRVNRFYLIVLRNVATPRDPDPAFEDKKVVSLDPGIKTVQTFYSPDGTHGTFLDGYEAYVDAKIALLRKLRERLRAIKAKRCEKKYRATRATVRRMRKVRHKLSHWMENQHYFIINELFREWDIVIFPALNVSRIIRKQGRAFDSLSALRLSCISHYKLRMRCMHRAETLEGKYVKEVGEPGTSRTCGRCGRWHHGLGGSRVFRCPGCHIEIDRDVNGARNNLLATFCV